MKILSKISSVGFNGKAKAFGLGRISFLLGTLNEFLYYMIHIK